MPFEVTQNMIQDSTKSRGTQPHLAKKFSLAIREEHFTIAFQAGAHVAALAAEMMQDQAELCSLVCWDSIRANAEDSCFHSRGGVASVIVNEIIGGDCSGPNSFVGAVASPGAAMASLNSAATATAATTAVAAASIQVGECGVVAGDF